MLVPKQNRIAVYSFLFKEGVMCAKKDFKKPKHDDVDVPNLEVIKLMTSLKSKEFVRETFNWQYFYWWITDEGIEYLRAYLHLPEDIVPATMKKPPARARPEGERRQGGFGRGGGGFDKGAAGGDRPRFGGRGGDGGYRREGGIGRGGM